MQPQIQQHQLDDSLFGSPLGSGGGGTSFVAGNGLTLTGSPQVLNVVGTAGNIVANANDIDLVATAVTPGSYTNTNLTVDAFGRITAAISGSGGGGGGSSAEYNAGAGLTRLFGSPITIGSPAVANYYFHVVGSSSINVAGSPGGPVSVIPGGVDHNALLNYVADQHVAHLSVTLTAGTGLTGGGDITTSRTFNLANTTVTPGSYTNTSLTVDAQGRLTAASSGSAGGVTSISAGAGLTGGGTGAVTLDVGAGTGITVNLNDVALDTASARNTDHSTITLTAGAGLTGGGDITASRSFDIGAGDGISVAADSVSVDSTVVRTSGIQTIGGAKDFTTNPTVNSSAVWHAGNDGSGSGLDADLLDGLNAVEAATGNTIVRRNASGYIFAAYLNQSSGQSENPTIGQFFVENSGADGYLRKASIAAVQSALGITGGAGTVTSVGLSGTNITVGGTNPVTTSGTITVSIPQAVGTSSNVQFGGVGVGTAPAAGEVRATGNVTAFFSDMRLKDVVRPIDNALAKVCTLDGFIFKANEKAQEYGINGDQLHAGLSAQQVKEVLPEIIREAPIDPEYMTLDYGKVVPLLIEAIKELKRELDTLKRGR